MRPSESSEKTFTNAQIKSALKSKSKGELVVIIKELAKSVDIEKEKIKAVREYIAHLRKNNWITEAVQCEILEVIDGKKND